LVEKREAKEGVLRSIMIAAPFLSPELQPLKRQNWHGLCP